jgi:tetratricopeptide (TPR) repeat protein
MRALVRFNELAPEQKAVINVAMTSQYPVILVQGVAGSGKTTIALNTLIELFSQTMVEAEPWTAILITYGSILRKWCEDWLAEELRRDGTQEWLAIWSGQVQPNHINIITYQDFCRLLLPSETFQDFVSDEECIDIIANIAKGQRFQNLLPSQIFAVITAFLKGRPEFRGKTFPQIEELIRSGTLEGDMRHPMHNAYWSVLPRIAEKIYKSYQSRLGERKDRADISYEFYMQLCEAERLMERIQKLSVEDISTFNSNQRQLPVKLRETLKWLNNFLQKIQEDGLESDADQLLEVLQEPSRKELKELKERIPTLVKRYGLRGTPIVERACQVMPRPFIIVDEAQDLSSIECQTIINFWFQMPRDPQMKLMIFGDLNQQLTPTGFTWDDITSAVYQRIGHAVRFTYDDRGMDPSPYRGLINNYRTTEQIARFAKTFMLRVGFPNLPHGIRNDYERNIIDPENTLKEPDIQPIVMIGTEEHFINGLKTYLTELVQKTRLAEETFMVISDRQEQLKKLESKLETPGQRTLLQQPLERVSPLSFLPILSCKGLEFEACVIWGLPIRERRLKPTPDLIGQWYTSITRPKSKLLLYLNSNEWEYFRHWSQEPFISSEIADIYYAHDPETVRVCLERIGETVLGREELARLAERYFEDFRRTRDIAALDKSILHYRLGGWEKEAREAARKGGEILENAGQLSEAVKYYKDGDDILGSVRCLVRLKRRDEAAELAAELEHRDVSRRKEAAECWELLEEWEKAINCYVSIHNMGNAEHIAARPRDIERRSACWALVASAYYEQGPKHWPDASRSWKEAERRDKVEEIHRECCRRDRYVLATQCWLAFGDKDQAVLIAQDRQSHRDYKNAAECWAILGEFYKSAYCWVKAKDQQRAEMMAGELEKQPRKAIEAVRCWHFICNRRDKAEILIDRLWRTGRSEERKTAMECCMELRWTRMADNLLRRLDPLRDLELAAELVQIRRVNKRERERYLEEIAEKAEDKADKIVEERRQKEEYLRIAEFCKEKRLYLNAVRCLHKARDAQAVDEIITELWNSRRRERKLTAIKCLVEVGKISQAREKIEVLEQKGDLKSLLDAFEGWLSLKDKMLKNKKMFEDTIQRAMLIAQRVEKKNPREAIRLWLKLKMFREAAYCSYRAGLTEEANRIIRKEFYDKGQYREAVQILQEVGRTEQAREIAIQLGSKGQEQLNKDLLNQAKACWEILCEAEKVSEIEEYLRRIETIREYIESQGIGFEEAQRWYEKGWLSIPLDSDEPLSDEVRREIEFVRNVTENRQWSEQEKDRFINEWKRGRQQ